jgi:hypothetical protein
MTQLLFDFAIEPSLESTQAKIIDATIPLKHDYKCGCECRFVKLNDAVGVKLYRTRAERDYAWQGQRVAAHYKVGPRAGVGIKLPDARPRSYRWGYVTQVAERPDGYSWRSTKKECALQRKLERLGIGGGDLHGGNVGLIDGKLVCIDFGKESKGLSQDSEKLSKLFKKIAA